MTEEKEIQETKQKPKRFKRLGKIGEVLAGSSGAVAAAHTNVFAADLSQLGDGGSVGGDLGNNLMILANLVAGVSVVIGLILTILGIVEFGVAYSQHDAASQSTALRRIVGGLMVAAVVAIVKLFAFPS